MENFVHISRIRLPFLHFSSTVSVLAVYTSHINNIVSANNSSSFKVTITASLTHCQSFQHVHNKHNVSIHCFKVYVLPFSMQTFATSSLIVNCFILHHQIYEKLYSQSTIFQQVCLSFSNSIISASIFY